MSADKPPVATLLSLRPGLPHDAPRSREEAAQPTLPARYSIALHKAIIANIRIGQSKTEAAKSAGLPPHTLSSWVADVQAGKAHPSIVQFMDDLDRAYAMCETDWLKTIAGLTPEGGDAGLSAKDKATNALALLERGRAKDWAPKVQVIINNELSMMFDRLQLEFHDEPRIQERILRVLAEKASE